MAQQQNKVTPTIGFRSIQLLKAQNLGIGAYGSVCKAKCDDLLCAAKIIHPTLCDPTAQKQVAPKREHRLPFRRFLQECEFMSAIRHPNIVQYLGTHQDPESCLPVLLMELMDESLTHFLESSRDPVPYHIQVNFSHDITMAISYLHSNGIVHRDLSSNNVLLYANVKAKVTDFGMAKLSDSNSQTTHISLTMVPGTAQVDPNHPLLPIALHCLKDRDVERPSAQEVCHRVAALKERPPYTESVVSAQKIRPEQDNATEKEEQIRELQQQLQRKDSENYQLKQQVQLKDDIIQEEKQIISARKQECKQLRETIKDKDRELQQLTQQLQSSKQVTAQSQSRIHELEKQLKTRSQTEVLAKPQPSLRDPLQTNHSDTNSKAASKDRFELQWRKGKRVPSAMRRDINAVVDGERVYCKNYIYLQVYAYNSKDDMWNQFPNCPNSSSSLAVVDNLLTTIGGYGTGSDVTNQLYSLTGEGSIKMWREVFLPMPTKRSSSTAVCSQKVLIVAGGNDQNQEILRTVEIMDTVTKQWSSAADLPEPLKSASGTICEGRIYMLGGWGTNRSIPTCTKSVYMCSLADLIRSCSRSLGERLAQSLSLSRSTVWNKVNDLPVIQSTCVSLDGRLLAIGGTTFNVEPTSDIYLYHPSSNTWEVISKMNTSRYDCFVATLPDNRLLVAGGYVGHNWEGKTDSMEIATLM